AISIFSGYTF
nr:immunoglobulin light chain junction region [Macaca mulatta]